MDERKSGLELYCVETGGTKVDLKVNIRTHVFLPGRRRYTAFNNP